MIFSNILHSFLPAALVLASVRGGSLTSHTKRDTLNNFIKRQQDVSVQGILKNVGPDGSNAKGLPPGVLIASPTSNPPCKS